MKYTNLYITLLLSLVAMACSTGVEQSEPPGFLKVYLQPSPADTNITIVNTTYSIDARDVFTLRISEGKAYSDSTFFILYENLNTFNENDIVIDLLQDNEQGSYSPINVYKSYLPQGDYTDLEFFLTSSVFQLKGFEVPVVTPDERPLRIRKEDSFSISSGVLLISTFK